jgi:hypothetical protein
MLRRLRQDAPQTLWVAHDVRGRQRWEAAVLSDQTVKRLCGLSGLA